MSKIQLNFIRILKAIIIHILNLVPIPMQYHIHNDKWLLKLIKKN